MYCYFCKCISCARIHAYEHYDDYNYNNDYSDSCYDHDDFDFNDNDEYEDENEYEHDYIRNEEYEGNVLFDVTEQINYNNYSQRTQRITATKRQKDKRNCKLTFNRTPATKKKNKRNNTTVVLILL